MSFVHGVSLYVAEGGRALLGGQPHGARGLGSGLALHELPVMHQSCTYEDSGAEDNLEDHEQQEERGAADDPGADRESAEPVLELG